MMDEETLNNIYNAYSSGLMSPSEKLEYEADVSAGVIQLPQGKNLITEDQAPQVEEAVERTQETAATIAPQGVVDAYFNDVMTPQEKQDFEQDAGRGLIKLPEGIKITSFHGGGVPGQPTTGYKLEKEREISDVITGGAEAALALGTGATGGMVGHIGGVLKGLADSIRSGQYGTEEGARLVEEKAGELMQALTYSPRTEAGQEYTQEVAEALAPLEALGPLGAQLEAAGRGALSARLPKAPKVRAGTKAKEAIQAAEKAGIKPLTSDILPPKTFVGKFAQATGERIPVVGTGEARAAQQAQRVSAVKGFLSEYGAVGADDVIDDVMGSLTKARQNKINKFSKIKGEVFAKMPDAAVDTTKTIAAIDKEISRLKAMKTTGVNPLIGILDDYKTAFKDQNIANIEALRKQLGDQLDASDLASVKTESGKASRNIYKTLNEDIGDFVKANGEPKDFNKWKIANRELSSTFSELQNGTLKSVLKRGDATPEAVKGLLFSQKPSDIKTLYRNLNREGRVNARAAILHQAVEKAGGVDNFSPERFGTQLDKLSKSTGVFFTGPDKKALQGLTKALDITKRGGIAGVKPTTGAELTTIATPTALTWFLGSDPLTGLAATGGVGLMAKIYESGPVRNALVKLANAPKAKEAPLTASLISIIQSQKEEAENAD